MGTIEDGAIAPIRDLQDVIAHLVVGQGIGVGRKARAGVNPIAQTIADPQTGMEAWREGDKEDSMGTQRLDSCSNADGSLLAALRTTCVSAGPASGGQESLY